MSTPSSSAASTAGPDHASTAGESSAEGPLDRPLNRRHVTAWALWDWGSASFNAVMVTFVFATYLASDSFGADDRGTQWLAAANAIGGLIVALTAPVIGQRSDQGGRRKLWLGINTVAVILLTALCFFVQPDEAFLLLGVVLIAAGNVAFEFAGVNYNAMLLQVATPKTIGKVSGIGWGAGYVGGIFLLLILYVGFIAGDTHWLGISNDEAMNIRVVALFSGLWFLLFAIPLFVSIPEHRATGENEKVSIIESYRRLWRTIMGLWRQQRNTFWFLAASAIFRDGVAAVFAYGAILGTTVYGVDPADILLFGIAANVVAAVGSFAGGWIDDRVGPKRVIMGSLIGLIAAAAIVFFLNGTTTFWIFGLLLCFFVGPVQSASRSFLGRLTTEGQAGEIYGLYATTGRAVSFLTPALISVAIGLSGDARFMVPAILLVLLAGMALLFRVRDPKVEDHLQPARPAQTAQH
ncbi:MFS transporter [Citricoccus sp. GCM10030269]|uniref:MFS transporter n=1 Tax=Citricoccus sp. GCM10030269 TaxID=3273388 RepID=UPI00361C0912